MKKFFTLIAAAMMAVGANAQTAITFGGQGDNKSWSWGYNQEFENGAVSLLSTSGYGRFDVCSGVTPTAGQSLVVDVANMTGEHQLSWKEDGTEKYSGTFKEGENTITFAGESITDVNILGPGTVTGNDVITINSVKLDGKQTGYATKWNYGVLASKWTSTGQWAEMMLNKVTGREDLWIVINTKDDIPENSFQLKVTHDGEDTGYLPLPGGVKTAKIDCGANVTEVSVQALVSGVVLNVASIYAYDGEPAGIEAVEAAPAAQKVVKTSKGIIKNGVKYNFAGQRVK